MEPGTQEWLDQVDEAPLDPDREIVDPHHHLWPPGGALPYGVDDLVADTGSGHNIVQTVFIECGAGYRTDGPEHLLPVGRPSSSPRPPRTWRLVTPTPRRSTASSPTPTSPIGELDAILDAHDAASGGRFRGIRDSLAHALEPDAHLIPGRYGDGKFENPAFRARRRTAR